MTSLTSQTPSHRCPLPRHQGGQQRLTGGQHPGPGRGAERGRQEQGSQRLLPAAPPRRARHAPAAGKPWRARCVGRWSALGCVGVTLKQPYIVPRSPQGSVRLLNGALTSASHGRPLPQSCHKPDGSWSQPLIPRGDFQATFGFKGYDEVGRLHITRQRHLGLLLPCCGMPPPACTLPGACWPCRPLSACQLV